MTVFKAKKSELPPAIFTITDTNIGAAFRTKSEYKFSNIVALTNGDLLGSSAPTSPGFRKSTDKGKTWGSLLNPLGTSYYSGSAFQSSLNFDSAPAGRIWWKLVYPDNAIYFSDDSLVTSDATGIFASIYGSPQDSWIQDPVTRQIIYSSISTEYVEVFDGSFFNPVSVASLSFIDGRNAGININADNDFLLVFSYERNASGLNLVGHYSTDGGSTWSVQGSVQGFQAIYEYPKQAYHITDNEFGYAHISYGGAHSPTLEFCAVDDQTTSDIVRYFLLVDPAFVSVRSLIARQSYSKVWMIAVECVNSTRIYQSSLGDYTNFDLVLELPYTQGGPISNLIEV